jgi:hypothetical protein
LDEATVGRRQQVFRVRVEGFPQEFLSGVRAIDVGRVDERDAGIDHLAEQGSPPIAVGMLAPDPWDQ